MNYNLPPGVSARDISGPRMPVCECGEEHNGETPNNLCPECQEAKEIVEEMQTTGTWPALPKLRTIETKLAKL